MRVKANKQPIVEILPGVLYTSQETAGYLRMERETLEVWRATGRYPALRARKIGGKVMYLGADILAFRDGPHEKAAPYIPKNPRPRPTLVRGRIQRGTKRGSR